MIESCVYGWGNMILHTASVVICLTERVLVVNVPTTLIVVVTLDVLIAVLVVLVMLDTVVQRG